MHSPSSCLNNSFFGVTVHLIIKRVWTKYQMSFIFTVVPLVVHTIIMLMLQCLHPIRQRCHQLQIRCNHMNFSACKLFSPPSYIGSHWVPHSYGLVLYLSKKKKLNKLPPSYIRMCPWCNGYRRRMWTRRHEFKSWTSLITFHIALIPLGKV